MMKPLTYIVINYWTTHFNENTELVSEDTNKRYSDNKRIYLVSSLNETGFIWVIIQTVTWQAGIA